MKKAIISLVSIIFIISLVGCSDDSSASEESDKMVVGVTAGPHEQVMEKVKELAAKDDFEIELKVFSDYIMPNKALSQGELDANVYQHQPFLDNYNDDQGTDLVSVAKAVNFPMGIYSEKIGDLSEIKEGAKIGLPNHSTGAPRALKLFEDAGLITLKEGAGADATVDDIAENPKNFDFVPLDPAQLPNLLGELSIAAINTNFAVEHGLNPKSDALHMEPKDSPWVNVIAVKAGNEDKPVVDKLLEYYHSPEVKTFIEDEFNGSVIAGW